MKPDIRDRGRRLKTTAGELSDLRQIDNTKRRAEFSKEIHGARGQPAFMTKLHHHRGEVAQ
jgi:hypothetical protein